ncbi:SepM family pheromone-processing serine protease [Kroppenstedtia eburnea]|uniref:SepM family pheromone-processing serine protease n=1 Tax=Kroppenstedtia eburnea TaxID=714067 RepID=UPI00364585BC
MEHSRPWYRRPWIITGLVTAALIVLLFVMPTPYYIMQPGSALEVRPMIQVEGSRNKEQGAFFMTTVSMREGNLLAAIISRWDSRYELLPRDQVLVEGEDPVEYERRQKEIMKQSQQNAILAAFREAGHPVKEKLLGVRVLRVLEKMSGAQVLKQGDIIHRVNGNPVRSPEELIRQLSEKKVGETVRLELTRNGKTLTPKVKLGSLGRVGGKDRPGIGIEPVTERKIQTEPEVTIRAEEIGGPSAGLMFSLEIINQLENGDLTRGYRVAGTGTISPEGEVGQIGGIQHKIVAADEEGADIFFVPADIRPGDSNEKKALRTAKEIGADMKVIPVKSLREALGFLKKQGLKKAS